MQNVPNFGYQQREAPQIAKPSRGILTRPPRALTIFAALVVVGVIAIVGYNAWYNSTQPPQAVDLRYPGAEILLYEDRPQEDGKDGLVGPVEDRVYGIPTAQASTTSGQDILAWYHAKLLARGWSFQNANSQSPFGGRENWMLGCDYLSIRIWDPKLAQPDFNDPKVYPITFEVRQQSLCTSS